MSDPCAIAFEKWCKENLDYAANVPADFKEIIIRALYNGFQAAWNQRAPRWIPVSERLPELDEEVLVCHGNGSMEIDCFVDWVDEGHGWEFSEKVTHWQPLPGAPND